MANAVIFPWFTRQKLRKQFLLLPILRAYVLAYISTTAPRLLNLVIHLHRKKALKNGMLRSILSIFKGPLALRRFPTFCATIVGIYSLLQLPIRLVYDNVCFLTLRRRERLRQVISARFAVSRFVAAFLSAWFGLQIFYPSRSITKPRGASPDEPGNEPVPDSTDGKAEGYPDRVYKLTEPNQHPTLLAGKTIDLSILVATRAIDGAIFSLWREYNSLPSTRRARSSIRAAISRHTDTIVFALSSGTIMWSWFYFPDRLPRAYNRWIGQAAQTDLRLIELLRDAREGRIIYGRKAVNDEMFQNLCKEYGWPSEWADPRTSIPIPCEVVHMGTGSSCHWHVSVRFAKAFKFAMATNLPLQLLVKMRKPSLMALKRAWLDAVRSSVFLATFVAFSFYGVCFSRTVLGPKLFSRKVISPMMWDSDLCVRASCILCGWSVLIEPERRRQELALFVAPRAVATYLPREYDGKYFWREKTAFSLGIAVLFTLAHDSPKRVRGVLGRLLHGVLQ